MFTRSYGLARWKGKLSQQKIYMYIYLFNLSFFFIYVATYLFLVSLKAFQPIETEWLLKIKMGSIPETSLSSSLYWLRQPSQSCITFIGSVIF